jgi:hypothetical protein
LALGASEGESHGMNSKASFGKISAASYGVLYPPLCGIKSRYHLLRKKLQSKICAFPTELNAFAKTARKKLVFASYR